VTTTKPLLKRDNGWETQFIPEWKVVAAKQLWFMKKHSQKQARKHISPFGILIFFGKLGGTNRFIIEKSIQSKCYYTIQKMHFFSFKTIYDMYCHLLAES
jgi:hypothetical protein